MHSCRHGIQPIWRVARPGLTQKKMMHGAANPQELEIALPWGTIAAQEWKSTEWNKQVLMLHGWQDNSNSFKRLIPLLPKNWWLIAIDFPGHGRSSSRPTGLPYHGPDYLIDLKATVNKLGWKSYSIIGHSMGAGVAQAMAACFPEEVTAVVSIDMIKPISAKAETSLSTLRKGIIAHVNYDVSKDTRTYTREEAAERWFEAIAYSLTRESVEILMERGLKEISPGRFTYSRDRRLQFPSLFRYTTEQHLDILKDLKSDLLIIKAMDTPQFEKQEIEDQFLHLYSKTCRRFMFMKAEGTHHLHLNTPENVASTITDFLSHDSHAIVKDDAAENAAVVKEAAVPVSNDRTLACCCFAEMRRLICGARGSFLYHRFSSTPTPSRVSDEQRSVVANYLDNLPKQLEHLQKTLYPTNSVEETLSVGAVTENLKARYHRIQKAMPAIEKRMKKMSDAQELESLAADLTRTSDAEMAKLADEDLRKCMQDVQKLEKEILDILVPEDAGDAGDIIMEVSAGVGGQEAMLFASEMYRMYERYSLFRGWIFEELQNDESEIGGIRFASASVSGREAYKHLKFEGGVHRVQRTPKTEKFGRVHTSTITVAILSKPKDVDVVLRKGDLKIETCRSSGKGGQHVNKTDSAVRIVHLPTNTAVECQEQRSQADNRKRAMEKLAAILNQKQLDDQMDKETSSRKLQVRSCDRSEKIRTYNFAQNRLTDHRIGITLHNLEEVLQGKEGFHELIQKTLAEYRRESIEHLVNAALTSGVASSQKTRADVKS
ncbi:uncharacterized protein LOC129588624 [Paramacrobiotus metropolitanus]|uniref:uncharacterized protein LOC129588624 n=1 Tax=Paramacrobiotus metropolitanus TaxID=2943436 RepID=UPI0024456CB8|nr:uncharacterized protein LOC129588624 [Paramacrobiotus metropolitanus]